jgi:hypothetical protein
VVGLMIAVAVVAITFPWDRDRDRQVIEAAIVGWMAHTDEGAEPLDPAESDWRVVIDLCAGTSELLASSGQRCALGYFQSNLALRA